MFRLFHGSNNLKPRTLELIDRMFEHPWFTKLGDAKSEGVHAISDWKEALHYLEDPDEVFLTIRNEYSSRLNREHRRAMQQWNDIVTRIKPLIEAPIDANVARLTLDAGEATRVRDMARWCVLNACVESEYADVANYGRFSEISTWIERGHLPCGWEGNYPEGRLAVF